MARLPAFKSYDIRGRLGAELNDALVYRVGRGFARLLVPTTVVVGRDVRDSSPGLQKALIGGLRDEGVDVVDLGLCGTEEVYFACAHLGAGGGLMVTASHNPIDYNGIKMVREESRPIDPAEMAQLHDLVAADDFGPVRGQGDLRARDLRPAYAAKVLSFLDPRGLNPIKLLVNAGNGVAGPAFDAIAAGLTASAVPFVFERMYFASDSSFPNGIPNPLLPENQPATSQAVRRTRADIGVAWDGDFDRCFFFDETGAFIDGEYVVALLAAAFLAKHQGAKIVYDPRVVWNIIDVVRRHGGAAVASRTGHANLKAAMRRVDAVYGGEMSAHHYFRDFMYCDSGMIPMLLVAELVTRSGRPLSALVAEMRAGFPSSGEINFNLADVDAAISAFEARYVPRCATVDRLDGISLELAGWRVNLRRSNTESLLRLNIETRGDTALLATKVAEVSDLLRRAGA
jgi:phosphomannomutase